MTGKLKDLDLGSLIEETVDQLEDWGLKDNVKAHSVVPPHLDPIRADESRVRQVLRKSGRERRQVHGRGIDHRFVWMPKGGRSEGFTWRTPVSGSPPDRIKTIFMAFEQGDGAKTRAQQGSGLGLAISSALCEMMGMQLSVESVLGEGSTFTVTLTPPP